jgi:hypothetical protein
MMYLGHVWLNDTDAVVTSFYSILNVVLFGMLLFLGLAIIGVQFFQGKFHRCYNPPNIDPLVVYHITYNITIMRSLM